MDFVEYEIENRVGYITLNRPDKRNALSHQIVAELKEAFDLAEADDKIKVIILKAKGEAFCAGADLAYLQQLRDFSFEENLADSNHLKELFVKIYTLKKVVIASVQGHALAGGCGLAAVCDFTMAVPEAKFGYTEVKIGFVPAIVMFFLIRKIGEQKARQLLLSGDLITSQEAAQLGLISKVVDKDMLDGEVKKLAEHLIKNNSGQSMQLTKQMMAHIQSLPMDEALDFAARENAKARATDDCKKGVDAFLKKEKLNW